MRRNGEGDVGARMWEGLDRGGGGSAGRCEGGMGKGVEVVLEGGGGGRIYNFESFPRKSISPSPPVCKLLGNYISIWHLSYTATITTPK